MLAKVIRWIIDAYEKNSDEWIKAIDTVGVDVEFIRRTWSLPEDDPGYGLDHPITSDNIAEVQIRSCEKLDLDSYDYFLSDQPGSDS